MKPSLHLRVRAKALHAGAVTLLRIFNELSRRLIAHSATSVLAALRALIVAAIFLRASSRPV